MAYTAPRTWTAGEVVTAGMLNQDVRDNTIALNARRRSWEHHRLIDGTQYHHAGSPLGHDFAQTFTTVINTIYAVPFITGAACSVTNIACSATADGGAGSPTVRLGIYTSGATSLKPATLVVGTTDTSFYSQGTPDIAVSASLSADSLYWVVMNTNTAKAVTGYPSQRGYPILGHQVTGNWTASGWRAAHTYAALPADGTTLTWNLVSDKATMPSFYLKLAA
jgi:hypothetical protein